MVKNNETFGVSAEIAFCKAYQCDKTPDESRGDETMVKKLVELINKNKDKLGFKKLEYTGEKGNTVDFKDTELNKTISIKTNRKKSDKVCPQEIGQCTKGTFKNKLWSKILNLDDPNNELDDKKIKEFILSHYKSLIPLYFDKLFCCDILIYIKETKESYNLDIIKKSDLKISKIKELIKDETFEFSKDKVENWYESTTLYMKYDKKRFSIGEFQIHEHRNCVKFRFNFTNLVEFLKSKKLIETIT